MMNKLLLSSFLCVLSLSVCAGETMTTVDRVLLYDQGQLVYVYPDGGVNNAPVCHGTNGNYYSFSMTRPMAEHYLNALLAAQARNVAVTFVGMGACIDQSVSETLNYITVNE